MNLCANTHHLNQYMRELDRETRRENAIEQRAADLMLDDCAPEEYSNFVEAIGECDVDLLKPALHKLLRANYATDKATRDEHMAAFCKAIASVVNGYWQQRAEADATNDIDNAECSHCFDAGCPRCSPLED